MRDAVNLWPLLPIAEQAKGRVSSSEGLGEEIQAVLADTGRANEASLEVLIHHRVKGVILNAKPGTESRLGWWPSAGRYLRWVGRGAEGAVPPGSAKNGMTRIQGMEPRLSCGVLEPILRQTKQGLGAAQVTWAMPCLAATSRTSEEQGRRYSEPTAN